MGPAARRRARRGRAADRLLPAVPPGAGRPGSAFSTSSLASATTRTTISACAPGKPATRPSSRATLSFTTSVTARSSEVASISTRSWSGTNGFSPRNGKGKGVRSQETGVRRKSPVGRRQSAVGTAPSFVIRHWSLGRRVGLTGKQSIWRFPRRSTRSRQTVRLRRMLTKRSIAGRGNSACGR